jgi:hypothetical protein
MALHNYSGVRNHAGFSIMSSAKRTSSPQLLAMRHAIAAIRAAGLIATVIEMSRVAPASFVVFESA